MKALKFISAAVIFPVLVFASIMYAAGCALLDGCERALEFLETL